MRLKLLSKNKENYDCWNVEDENGKHHIVDLCVDNSDIRPLLAVGSFVNVDYLFPHLEIAVNVKEATCKG